MSIRWKQCLALGLLSVLLLLAFVLGFLWISYFHKPLSVGSSETSPWVHPTALQFCGSPDALTTIEPTAFNDWTVVHATLSDSLQTWTEQLSVYGDKPFWGYINWMTPELSQRDAEFFPSLYSQGGFVDVFGNSSFDQARSKGRVCILEEGERTYVREVSRALFERGVDGLFMDMAWQGWNDCPFDYSPELVAGFRQWLVDHKSREEITEAGVVDVASFDLSAHARSQGVTTEQKGDVFDPVLHWYSTYKNSVEYDFLASYKEEMETLTQQAEIPWGFTLNRPTASMFLILDLLESVRHETFIGRDVDDTFLSSSLSEEEIRRYPQRDMIAEFSLFAEQGKPLWSSNSPHFETNQIWRDNLLFLAETYAAGGIGHFPTTHEESEWAQTCPVGPAEDETLWYAQMEQLAIPFLDFLELHEEFYGLPTSSRVALLYPIDSNLYGQADSVGFAEKAHPLSEKQEEMFLGAGLLLEDLHIPYQAVAFGDNDDVPTDFSLTVKRLEGFDMLVLPSAWVLSETQIEILETFVREGGTLLTFYKTGTHDLNFFERYESRSDWNRLVHTQADQKVAFGEGLIASIPRDPVLADYYFDPRLRDEIIDRVQDLVPELDAYKISTDLPASVHILQKSGTDSEFYHLLNYDYHRTTDQFIPTSDQTTFVFSWNDTEAPVVIWHAPEVESIQLPPTKHGSGTWQIFLPSFMYYAVVEIR